MTYQNIKNTLNEMAQKSITISEALSEELDMISKNYLGDMYKEKAAEADRLAKERLANLVTKAQEVLDNGLRTYQEVIDIKFFADIPIEQSAELEMIARTSLDHDEIKAYFRKFKNNFPALRRLEKIAGEKGYKVLGLTYRNELDFMNAFKNAGQGVVNAMAAGDRMRINIATNYLEGKVQEYDAVTSKETVVLPKGEM